MGNWQMHGNVDSDEGDAIAETESEHKIYSQQRSRMNGGIGPNKVVVPSIACACVLT